jgi:hypothetical protein
MGSFIVGYNLPLKHGMIASHRIERKFRRGAF